LLECLRRIFSTESIITSSRFYFPTNADTVTYLHLQK